MWRHSGQAPLLQETLAGAVRGRLTHCKGTLDSPTNLVRFVQADFR